MGSKWASFGGVAALLLLAACATDMQSGVDGPPDDQGIGGPPGDAPTGSKWQGVEVEGACGRVKAVLYVESLGKPSGAHTYFQSGVAGLAPEPADGSSFVFKDEPALGAVEPGVVLLRAGVKGLCCIFSRERIHHPSE